MVSIFSLHRQFAAQYAFWRKFPVSLARQGKRRQASIKRIRSQTRVSHTRLSRSAWSGSVLFFLVPSWQSKSLRTPMHSAVSTNPLEGMLWRVCSQALGLCIGSCTSHNGHTCNIFCCNCGGGRPGTSKCLPVSSTVLYCTAVLSTLSFINLFDFCDHNGNNIIFDRAPAGRGGLCTGMALHPGWQFKRWTRKWTNTIEMIWSIIYKWFKKFLNVHT